MPSQATRFLIVIAVAASKPLFAQTSKTPVHPVETSVSLGVFVELAVPRIADVNVLYNGSTATFETQGIKPTPGVAISFRQSFHPWLGYSVNFGYARPRERYTFNSSSLLGMANGIVDTNRYEVSLSYIAQKHLTPRFSLFGEAGAGTLAFADRNRPAFEAHSNSFRLAGVTGFGMDYRLTHGLGLRAEYRGLFSSYPFPDYSNSAHYRTLISEPTLSATYTFGHHTAR